MSSPGPTGRGPQRPVGDADALRRLATRLLDTADGLASSAAVLTAVRADLADAVWQGEAARAFAPALDDLPPRFERIAASYRAAGRALADYAPRLARAQADAATAFDAAASALTRLGDVVRGSGAGAVGAAARRDADHGAERVARAESRAAEDRRAEIVAAWRRDASACAEALLDAASLAEAAGAGPSATAQDTRAMAAEAGQTALSVIAGVAALVGGVCSLVAFAFGRAGAGTLSEQVAATQDDGSLAGLPQTEEGRELARVLAVDAGTLDVSGGTVSIIAIPG